MAMSSSSPRRALPFVALVFLVASDCSDSPAEDSTGPVRDCPRMLWAKPSTEGAELRVVGSWDGWKEPGIAMTPGADGWYTTRVDVPEGEYGYLVVESGVQNLDGYNPLTTYRGNDEVSLLLVPSCDVPEIRVDSIEPAVPREGSPFTIHATFLRAKSRSPLAPSSVSVRTDGATSSTNAAQIVAVDTRTGVISLSFPSAPRGKNLVHIQASDDAGHRADQPVSVFVDPLAKRWEDAVVYQIMVDRYRASDGAPLAAPPSPGLRAGGTLDGVRAEIENGTFERLGVTAIWLSPPTTTPDETRIGRSGRPEHAYHGYWQLDSREVDPRLGGDAALERLVTAAHRRGLQILIDIVPNHIYEKNPRYLLHREQGWFHEGGDKCVCGDTNCSWNTDIEHCWFTEYLPDYRFQNADVMRTTSEDAAYWVTRFHVDGVRIDAVPMMPRAATRRLMHALRGAVAPAGANFAMGEIYTGTDGLEMIRYYLGPDGLPSAFDFPFMWKTRDAIATNRVGFDDLDAMLANTEVSLEGSGSVLARMLDNHDTSRFLTEATGIGGDSWTDPPAQPTADEPYRRLELGLALLFTLPGIPVLYYGDEIGLAGLSDPDSRRVMPGDTALLPRQRTLLALTQRLGTLRAKIEALRSGARQSWVTMRDAYAFTRRAPNSPPVLVLLSKKPSPTDIAVPAGALPGGNYIDVFTGERFSVGSEQTLSVMLAPLSFRILVAEGTPLL